MDKVNTTVKKDTLKTLFQEDMDRFSGRTYESIDFISAAMDNDDYEKAELAFATVWLNAYFAALDSVGLDVPDNIFPRDLI